MKELAPSIITLCAFIIPVAVFVANLERFNSTDIVHAVLMAFICLSLGVVFAGAMITLTQIESQTLIAACVMLGSLTATMTRMVWRHKLNKSY